MLQTTPETFDRDVKAYMDKEQFWPNSWFISDHGNAHLQSLDAEDDDNIGEGEDDDAPAQFTGPLDRAWQNPGHAIVRKFVGGGQQPVEEPHGPEGPHLEQMEQIADQTGLLQEAGGGRDPGSHSSANESRKQQARWAQEPVGGSQAGNQADLTHDRATHRFSGPGPTCGRCGGSPGRPNHGSSQFGNAQPSEGVSSGKAKQILRDNSAQGHPLTEKQKGMFGAAAGRANKAIEQPVDDPSADITDEVGKAGPFDRERYKFAHGSAPRGQGRWAFTYGKPHYDDVSEVHWFDGKYSDAKHQAEADAKRQGFRSSEVYTQS